MFHFSSCHAKTLCSLSAAHSEVSRQHAAASVPRDVPCERGQRGDVPDRHEEHVQPQTAGAQEVRPEGEEELLSTAQRNHEVIHYSQ